MLIVLSEASFYDRTSLNARELHTLTEAARLFGCRIYPLPPDFSVCETAENALAYVPHFGTPIPGVWIGYIPTVERYQAVYEAARAKGVLLVNSPEQYQTAMEFDHFYPLLTGLTLESLVLHSLEECATVEGHIGYPVFVKGAVKSNKERGWSACVAENESELRTIAASLLAREGRSRGRIIVRRLAALRTVGAEGGNFPLGREYRVFLYQQGVLAVGFYWEGYADTFAFTAEDERAVRELAQEASQRVGTPLLAVDVGQLETGEWIVIEVGDAQFTGLSQVSALELWGKISQLTHAKPGAGAMR